ncbi:hypothetical protein B296_00030391 [Ensete ventricosum]|nr:hypothetical protein B296_00030391 [Ensete ventricosum]
MGFVVGLLLGVVVGVGLVMVFVRSENARSKSRGQLVLLVPPPLALVRCLVCFYAASVVAFARMTIEDSRKLLPAEFYPSWVVFSQRQKFSYFYLLTELFMVPLSPSIDFDLIILTAEMAQP